MINILIRKKASIKNTLSKTGIYILLMGGSILMITPFLWMISTSLKDEGSIFAMPPQLLPNPVLWQSYGSIFTELKIWQGFINTFMIIIPPTFIGLFSSALAAYSFSHINFKGRDKLFFVLLMTLMLPGVVTMIPTYVIFSKMNWVDSWLPLMIPGSFGSAACVFFLRQYFKTIPKEMIEAAKIDGMTHPNIFIKIIVPLGKTALITQGVFGFLAGYNDFMGPLIYINSSNKQTLQLMLSSLQGMYSSSYNILMAGAVVAIIPTLIIYGLCQKVFVEGISMTGIKG